MNDDVLSETTHPDREIRYIDISSVNSSGTIDNGEVMTFGAAPSRARRLVRHGDVVVSTVRTYLRAIAPIKQPSPSLVFSTGFAVVRPGERLEPRYAAYALQNCAFVEEVVANSEGVAYPGISPARLAALRVPVLPRDAQGAVADYLDFETARIDNLINRKRCFIDLLFEKRTALISHAVTKGLDPEVEMKDCGVAWLGPVPATWDVVGSKRVFALRNARAWEEDAQLTASQTWGVIPQEEFMTREGRRVVQVIKDPTILKHVEPGDFVISMRSFQGGIERSDYRGCVSSAYVVLRPRSTVYPPFFTHLLKSSSYIQALQSTSDLVRDGQALRYENFALVRLPLVPMEEQVAIAHFLDAETSHIDSLIQKTRRSVELLKEYRNALISAAVTGQIDIPKSEITEGVA
ncbi:MAG: restriction endonuclease subunit S [Coriobacteriia bacterium]